MIEGLLEAAQHDRKILVEETIVGREIECAVFGGGTMPVEASGVGEILAAADFSDFDAKYYNEESSNSSRSGAAWRCGRDSQKKCGGYFKAVDGYGLARVDFFVKNDGEVVFNEINTLPGFTAISMYPMLLGSRGIDKKTLVNRLIEHGLAR